MAYSNNNSTRGGFNTVPGTNIRYTRVGKGRLGHTTYFCPSCSRGDMTFVKDQNAWMCSNCWHTVYLDNNIKAAEYGKEKQLQPQSSKSDSPISLVNGPNPNAPTAAGISRYRGAMKFRNKGNPRSYSRFNNNNNRDNNGFQVDDDTAKMNEDPSMHLVEYKEVIRRSDGSVEERKI